MSDEQQQHNPETVHVKSVLSNTFLPALMDHYRTMIMHRYPSELCKLFQQYLPEEGRHSGDESLRCSTLFYHYLIHGYRNAKSLRVLQIVPNENSLIMIQRIMLTYLHGPEKTRVMTWGAFKENYAKLENNSFDLIIFDCGHPTFSSQENMEHTLFNVQLIALYLLKLGGIVAFEGFRYNVGHYLYGTLNTFYLYPQYFEQYVFSPFLSTPAAWVMSICRKKQNYLPWIKAISCYKPDDSLKKLVLVTSSIKSVGNNNVISEATRLRQLIHSIRSVRRNIPNAIIVVSETSELSDDQRLKIEEEDIKYIRIFKEFEGFKKSYCESLVIQKIISEFLTESCEYDSFIKLSGRYLLLDNMPTFDYSKIICKRLHDRDIMSRFFNIPKDQFPRFKEVMDTIINDEDVINTRCDIEHGLGRYYPEMNEAANNYDYIGCVGFYATNLQMIVE
jgi:hypothetical protein